MRYFEVAGEHDWQVRSWSENKAGTAGRLVDRTGQTLSWRGCKMEIRLDVVVQTNGAPVQIGWSPVEDQSNPPETCG